MGDVERDRRQVFEQGAETMDRQVIFCGATSLSKIARHFVEP